MDMCKAHLYIITLTLFSLDSHAIGCGAPDMMAELLDAIDIKLKMSATIHIHHIFTRLVGSKYCFVLGREVLELYARGEVMHTKRSNSQRCGIILRRDWLTLHLTVIPERALHTLLTLETALRGHQALHHLVVRQVATCSIEQLLLLALDAIKNSYSMIRLSVIITPHHRRIVGIRTNHGNLLLAFLQRKNIVVVLKQHNTLTRHIE